MRPAYRNRKMIVDGERKVGEEKFLHRENTIWKTHSSDIKFRCGEMSTSLKI